jgi:hypothetical protein
MDHQIPSNNADEEEIKTYEAIVKEILLIFMLVLDKMILQKICIPKHPY